MSSEISFGEKLSCLNLIGVEEDNLSQILDSLVRIIPEICFFSSKISFFIDFRSSLLFCDSISFIFLFNPLLIFFSGNFF